MYLKLIPIYDGKFGLVKNIQDIWNKIYKACHLLQARGLSAHHPACDGRPFQKEYFYQHLQGNSSIPHI